MESFRIFTNTFNRRVEETNITINLYFITISNFFNSIECVLSNITIIISYEYRLIFANANDILRVLGF